jgi:hypothetical protein
VAFGLYNIDFADRSVGLVSIRSANGKLSRPRRVPHAQEVLAASYDGNALQLLTAAGGPGLSCCTFARALTLTAGRWGHQHTLLTDVNGDALGSLVALPKSHMLAAMASGAGTWVAQAPAIGRFGGGAHRLTSSSVSPQTVAAAALPNGRSAVAWTETSASLANVPATGIVLATGSAKHPPRSGRPVLNVPAGHAVDELALAGATAGPTAAWTESWFDRFGTYRGEVAVADLSGRVRARTFVVPGELASGVTLAADAKGDQVLAWKTCDPAGGCSVHAVSRVAHHRFGTPQRLGGIDVGEDPAAAVAPDGEAVVAWVAGGHVLAANRRSAGGRFGSAVRLSNAPNASSVAVAFGPDGQALAAWTQGIARPSVQAAFRP